VSRPFVGVYATNDPRRALRFENVADAVAVCEPMLNEGLDVMEVVVDLKLAGFRVDTWEANTYTGELIAGTEVYHAQAEGPDQREGALANNVPGAKALVGTVTYAVEPGWHFCAEWYDGYVEPPSYFGVAWSPVIDLTGRYTFKDYAPTLELHGSIWIWDAEETPDESINQLQRWLEGMK